MSLYEGVTALIPELVDVRRTMHRHPEIGFDLEWTSEFVQGKVKEIGLADLRTGLAKTGMTAVTGSDGRTLLMRADMDALPVTEENDVEYKSENDGRMHACGHDGHTSMLLGAARLLSGKADGLGGRVKFMFQPAEEGPGGALPMIEEGILEGVDGAVALHLWAELKTGKIGVRSGPVLACADRFTITVNGKGGHGAQPHLTQDPIVAAAQLVNALQTITSRNTDPQEALVVTVGTIQGGTAFNIIPEKVEMHGTVRAFNPDVRAMAQREIQVRAEGIGKACGCDIEVDYVEGYPPTINDAEMAELARAAAAEVVGEENVVELPPSMGGEDMAYVLERVPGVFVFVGSRNEEKGTGFPHHHPRFNIDEDALPIGVSFLMEFSDRYFGAAK